jgi:hypothetical protein
MLCRMRGNLNVAMDFELPAVCTLVVSLYTGFYFPPTCACTVRERRRVAQADALGDIVLNQESGDAVGYLRVAL